MIIAIDAVVTVGILGGVLAYWNCKSCQTPTNTGVVPVAYHDPQLLAREFAEAFQAKDLEQLKQCFCWDRVDAWTSVIVAQSMADDMQHALIEVSVLPSDTEEKLEYEANGIKYIPNLKVVGRLKVAYQRSEESEPAWTTYWIGHQSGKPLIALSAPAG